MIGDNKLNRNSIILTSKGAEAKEHNIECLLPSDKIYGNRYLVLVSGDYIDKNDADDRGNIKILKSDQYEEQNKDALIPDEVILLDTIVNIVKYL